MALLLPIGLKNVKNRSMTVTLSTRSLLGVLTFLAMVCDSIDADAKGRPPSPKQLSFEGPKAPYRARKRPSGSMKPNGMGLVEIGTWPNEPTSPDNVEVKRFARSLRHLCGWMPTKRPLTYSAWILGSAKHFGVDPFLLAAWIYDSSQCRPKHKGPSGLGLAELSVPMHLNFVKDRTYTYWVYTGSEWKMKTLALPKYLFYEAAMKQAESNIYFAAALLRVSMEQCPHNDGAFGSLPHRHPISHAVWGDRVRGTDAEDRILIARRRLIRHYAGIPPLAKGSFNDLPLVSPMAGSPRKITSKMGDDRDGGRRRHKGIDFASPRGEWIRSVADGTVVLSGAALRGGGFQRVAKGEATRWAKRRLGAAGLYVKIRHAGGLQSLYMHLDDLLVERGDNVSRGQIIGTVGRTGIRASQAHLHFELRHDGRHLDPLKLLGDLVISPMKTYRGLRLDYEQRRERRRRRR